MTTLREAALLAVAKKVGVQHTGWYGIGAKLVEDVLHEAALHGLVALDKPVQEPVATVTSETGADISMSWWHEPALPVGTKLYTSPPQRKPLSAQEIKECERKSMVNGALPFEQREFFARAIEDAHGIGSKT